MPLRSASVSVAVALLLSGCAVGSEPDLDGVAGPSDEATVSEDEGAIEGVVLDDALMPVTGASVLLDDTTETKSAADGTFAFSLVDPGTYTVRVLHEAYQGAAATVSVTAGDVASVRLTLVRLPSADAYHETLTQAGFMACGVGGRIAGIPWTFAACGPIRILGFDEIDNFMLNWPGASPMTDVVGFFGETEWQSTQVLAKEIHVIWFVVNVPYWQEGWDAEELGDVAGASPLSLRIDLDDLQDAIEDGGFCEFDECLLNSGHYPSNQTFGTPVDQTVVFQQRFDDYLTLFRGGELPESFTAIPDA